MCERYPALALGLEKARAENVDIKFDCAICGATLFLSLLVRVRLPTGPFLPPSVALANRSIFFFSFSFCATHIVTYNFLGAVSQNPHQYHTEQNTSSTWRLRKAVPGCRPMQRR